MRFIDPDGMGPYGIPSQVIEFGNYVTNKVQGAIDAVSNFVTEAIKYTDVNDPSVLVTTVTRRGDAVNYDGSPADGWDIAGASLGAIAPFVGGKIIGDSFRKEHLKPQIF